MWSDFAGLEINLLIFIDNCYISDIIRECSFEKCWGGGGGPENGGQASAEFM